MPEGPTIQLHADRLKPFEQSIVEDCGGYDNAYAEELIGKRIEQVSAYAKYIIFQFDTFFITVHLRLFGSYLVNDKKEVNPSFYLGFKGDIINFYVVKVKKWAGKPTDHFSNTLDPFSEEFDYKKVKRNLLNSAANKMIGIVLMDQSIFPGVGNVIRNEVLFLSKIHPNSIVKEIPTRKLTSLIKKVQEFSIASIPLIQNGSWKSSSAVYGKKTYKQYEVEKFEMKKIKRKTFVINELQTLYT